MAATYARSRPRHRTLGTAAALAAVVLAAGGVAAARPADPSSPGAPDRHALQRAFAAAAAEFHVPEAVLLAVSYQETLWESHHGRPSMTGNYNVMALTEVPDAVLRAAGPSGGEAGGRGDAPAGPAPRSARSPRSAAAPPPTAAPGGPAATPPALHTLDTAARLLRTAPAALRRDPRQSVRGAAALLASYERAAVGALPRDPARWYPAVARYSQSATPRAADQFADRVFATLRSGAHRTTSDGQTLDLAADSSVPVPAPSNGPGAECPQGLACTFTPAAYALPPGVTDPSKYGNYDLAKRPGDGDRIRYIVIHDTETTLAAAVHAFQQPSDQASAHYVIGQDGSVVQMVPTGDIAWHAGNRSVNAHSIGIEHEGYGLRPGSWYTEQEYRSSAALVRYLADRFHVPLDREHLLGHEDVPPPLDAFAARMHWDPGPYWDWQHYLDLLGAPVRGTHRSPAAGDVVTIDPPYAASYQPPLTGCGGPDGACPAHPADFVYLRTGPSDGAPLIGDPLLGPSHSATTRGSDWSDKAVVGQSFVVAAVRGDWTAVWFGGRKAWFKNPGGAYAVVSPRGRLVVTPAGRARVHVYGRAYPEPGAYPAALRAVGDSAANSLTPLRWTIAPGQRYVATAAAHGDFYYVQNLNCSAKPDCVLVVGRTSYYPIRYNHRLAFVRTTDVRVVRRRQR